MGIDEVQKAISNKREVTIQCSNPVAGTVVSSDARLPDKLRNKLRMLRNGTSPVMDEIRTAFADC